MAVFRVEVPVLQLSSRLRALECLNELCNCVGEFGVHFSFTILHRCCDVVCLLKSFPSILIFTEISIQGFLGNASCGEIITAQSIGWFCKSVLFCHFIEKNVGYRELKRFFLFIMQCCHSVVYVVEN